MSPRACLKPKAKYPGSTPKAGKGLVSMGGWGWVKYFSLETLLMLVSFADAFEFNLSMILQRSFKIKTSTFHFSSENF